MTTVIVFALVLASLGAFDTLYYHEYRLRLAAAPTAKRELRLHAIRDYLYATIFMTFAWIEWHGVLALLFALIILAEIFITVWDFIEEDLTRKLPAGERAMHTIMAIVYGGLLAYLFPVIYGWWSEPAGFVASGYGLLSVVLTALSAGVFLSGVRDILASRQLGEEAS